MSVTYAVYFDSKEPIELVMARLENIVGASFVICEGIDWDEVYRVEVLGLGLQLKDWRDNAKHYEGEEESRFSYQLCVRYVREITGLSEGKDWVRLSVVEIARMISRNLNCFSAVMAEDLITHRFEADNTKN